jgi:1-acyl-sn-glycerol-3-phosphate acyltransferase
VFPVSELLCISLLLRIWPRLRVYSICASSTFKVPVWRHILSWTGARPATRHHFRCVLPLHALSPAAERGVAGSAETSCPSIVFCCAAH